MRTGSYLLIVQRDAFELQIWRRRAVPPLQYRLLKTHPISVGKQGHATEAGVYWVQARAKNPEWRKPRSSWVPVEEWGQVIPGGAANNPIVGAWIGVNDSGVGIHGTDDLLSLGKRASHGCIRTAPEVATDLYYRVRKGTPVVIL